MTTMDKEKALEILDEAKSQTREEQLSNKPEILQAMKSFWHSNPTEEEFGAAMSGTLMFPEFVYHMVKYGYDATKKES